MEEIDERHPDSRRSCASTRTSAGCWCACPDTARSRRGKGVDYLAEGRVEGVDPLSTSAGAPGDRAPTASRRRRPDDRQLLRPRPGRGLRLRGADLVPRRPRRHADAPVSPLPGSPSRAAAAARGAASTHAVIVGGGTTRRVRAPSRSEPCNPRGRDGLTCAGDAGGRPSDGCRALALVGLVRRTVEGRGMTRGLLTGRVGPRWRLGGG